MVVTDPDLYCKTQNVLEQQNAAYDHSRFTPLTPLRLRSWSTSAVHLHVQQTHSTAGNVVTVGNSRLNRLSCLPIVSNACTAGVGQWLQQSRECTTRFWALAQCKQQLLAATWQQWANLSSTGCSVWVSEVFYSTTILLPGLARFPSSLPIVSLANWKLFSCFDTQGATWLRAWRAGRSLRRTWAYVFHTKPLAKHEQGCDAAVYMPLPTRMCDRANEMQLLNVQLGRFYQVTENA